MNNEHTSTCLNHGFLDTYFVQNDGIIPKPTMAGLINVIIDHYTIS